MKNHLFYIKGSVPVCRKEDLPVEDGMAELLTDLWNRQRVPLAAAVYFIAERRFGNTEDEALEAAARELSDALQAKKIEATGRSPKEAFELQVKPEWFQCFSRFIPNEDDLLMTSAMPEHGKGQPVLIFDHCLAADYRREGDCSERISHGPATDRFENFDGAIFYDLTVQRKDLLRLWPKKAIPQMSDEEVKDWLRAKEQAEGKRPTIRSWKEISQGVTQHRFSQIWHGLYEVQKLGRPSKLQG